MAPERGEVWYADLDPARGHEQVGQRSVLIVSATPFNKGPAGLVIILPLTTRDRGIPVHVSMDPGEGGVSRRSLIKCEDIRSVDRRRLTKRLGVVSDATMSIVAANLRTLLEL